TTRGTAHNNRRALVATGRARSQLGIPMVRDGFRIEHVESGGGAGDVHALAVVGYGRRMKAILLIVLEVSGAAREILGIAEIEKAAVREKAGGVGLFVHRRT